MRFVETEQDGHALWYIRQDVFSLSAGMYQQNRW